MMMSVPPDGFRVPLVELNEGWIEPIVHITQRVSKGLGNQRAIKYASFFSERESAACQILDDRITPHRDTGHT